MQDALAAAALGPLLEAFRVPGYQELYVIGSFDRKTSLYFQQVRALNLAWLLSRNAPPVGTVGVIGGGIAGVTAAAALASQGQAVTLLEKGPELLALQRHSRRPIHPHIYDWPAAGAENPRADLPLLDWQAGLSCEVAAGWLKAFADFARIEVLTGAAVEALAGTDGGYQVTWRQQGEFCSRHFERLILALGVGLERSLPGLPLHSYWEQDGILDTAAEVLVSGCGEGGLLEVLRLRLQDFRPEQLLPFLADAALCQTLLAWEAAASAEVDAPGWLGRRYAELTLPALDARLKQLMLPKPQVILHGPHPTSPLNGQATILNRLLVSRLLKLGGLSYMGGSKLLEARQADQRWRVQFDDRETRVFDAVLVRHGASSVLRHQFPSLWEQALRQGLKGSPPALLTPLWPAQAFA